jgi:hypothetical protein
MDSEKRKLAIMGILSVLILIAIFILLYFTLFKPKDEPSEEATASAFPESSERIDTTPITEDNNYVGVSATSSVDTEASATESEENIPAELVKNGESDWRNEMIIYSSQDETNPSNENMSTAANNSANDLSDPTGTIVEDEFEIDYDYSTYYPEFIEFGNDGQLMRLEDMLGRDQFISTLNQTPSLADEFVSVESCGTVDVSFSEDDEIQTSELDEYEESICFGEAILRDCRSATISIQVQNNILHMYVTERENGICSIGSGYLPTHATFCDLHMESRDLEKQYTNEPGKLFKDLFEREISGESSSDSSCQLYEV